MSVAAKIARRALLAGAAAAVLATAMPAAEALPPFKRGGHPKAGGGTPLALALTFPDGNVLNFSQASATDAGDYGSAFGFTQKCFRQRASGNGDYRDGFTVFFRPDADGSRSEVVIEYGTEWVFSTTAAPVTPNGLPSYNLFIPPSPVLAKTTGGSSGQSGTAFVWYSYVFPTGETVPCKSSFLALAVGDLLVGTSPPAMGGATAYRVYANFGGGTATFLQAELPIGTDWAEAATGLLLSGTAHKTLGTATIYTAVISGGVLGSPVSIPVKSHWRNARWRWYSAPRPVVRNYNDLLTLKAILPLNTAYQFSAGLPYLSVWAGPMDIGAAHPGWGDTGDRAELGFTNEWVSSWFFNSGNAALEASWRSLAESTGTATWWWRDVATGALFDTGTYPYMAFKSQALPKYTLPTLPPKGDAANFFQMDQSHTPDFSFIAWLLTDDPYFLEGAQAEALFAVAATDLPDTTEGLPYIFDTEQPRATAWGARSLFRMAGYAPVSTPSWLKNRSYWVGLLPNNLTYANKFLASATRQCAVFGAYPQTNEHEGFMQDYLTIVFSWIKYSGLFPSWDAVVRYVQESRRVISDITDADGWDHRLASPYYIRLIDALLGAGSAGDAGTGGNYATASTANTAANWIDIWNWVKAKAPTDPGNYDHWTDPATWAPDTLQNTQHGLIPVSRAALAASVVSGGPSTLADANWLAAHMASDFAAGTFFGWSQYKWMISPT